MKRNGLRCTGDLVSLGFYKEIEEAINLIEDRLEILNKQKVYGR